MESQATISGQGRHNLFSIKPYKNNLLTPGANYWIICIHLVILVMATSEAIAWGYLGSLFGKATLGVLAAGITFLFMFLIIWVIDVSFVTMDLSRSYYDKIILKKESDRWVDNTRLGVGLLGRVAIVFVSLSISAPFLAQIVFKQDIDNEIDRRNMARVSMVSDSMLIAKDEEIAALDAMILERETALITETAGKGSSGNYGAGPVTRAMERNIERLRDERAALLQDKTVMNQTVQSLTVDEFAALHNVDLINNGVRTREEILGGLMENPEYRTAKTAITAFLAFIFAALVLLKLFQPRSVRIYYNEKLQDLYREYLAGHLNKWIAKPEQSIDGQSQMSPLRFEDWCVSTYSVVRNEDFKRRDSRKIYNLFKMKIEQLEEEKAEIQQMMKPVERDFERAMADVNQVKIELLEAEHAIQRNSRTGEEIGRQLENISEDLQHHRFQGSDVLIAVSAKKEAEEKLRESKQAGLGLMYKYDLIRHRFDLKDAAAKQVEALMAKMRANFRDLQEKIDRERTAYTDLVVNGHVVDIPGRHQPLEEEDRTDIEARPTVEAEAALQHDFKTPAAARSTEMESDMEPDDAVNPVDNLLTEQTSEETFDEAHEDVHVEDPFNDTVDAEAYDRYADEGLNDLIEDHEEDFLDHDAAAMPVIIDEFLEEPRENPSKPYVIEMLVTPEEQADEEAEETVAYWDFQEEPIEEEPFVNEGEVRSEDILEEESMGEESPVSFVDDERLNAYAEAFSAANYKEEEPDEAPQDVEDLTPAAYFVDPALIAYNGYDAVGVDVDDAMQPAEDSADQAAMEAFNEEVQSFLAEAGDDVDSLEDVILKKITGRNTRPDRNGKGVRKGTFGKTLGKGV